MERWNRSLVSGEREARRGGALVASLFLVLVVSILGASFLQLSTSLTRRREHANDTKQAVYLAEAGLAEAYIGMGIAKTGNVGTQAAPASYGGGLFWVEATDLGNGQRQLRSTGMWGSGRATLGLVAELVEASVGETGFFMVEDIVVEPGSLFDSYDSSAGAYADQVTAGINNDEGHLGSNGDVTLNGGTRASTNSNRGGPNRPDSSEELQATLVMGDVTPGVGYGVSTNGAVTVSGSTTPRAQALTLPPVETPDITLAPAYVHTDPLPLVIAPGDAGYESLEIGHYAQLIVVGPARLRVGQLRLEPGSSLTFDVDAGPVDLYVADVFNLADGATITNSAEDPTRVTIQVAGPPPGGGTDPNVALDSSTSFFGTIYAPEGVVTLGTGFEVFGGIMAQSVVLGEGVRFHRDLALASAENSLPRLLSWRVVDIPDRVAGSSGDPFKLLGVDPAALPAPSAAHEDQWLVLSYKDDAGVASTYDGWESAFDWSNVSEVTSGSRDGTGFGTPDGGSEPPPPAPLEPPPGTPFDWMADPTISSADLAVFLIGASPLTRNEINGLLARDPPMDTPDLFEVLRANTPLPHSAVVNSVIEYPALPSPEKTSILVDNSPLADTQLNNAIRTPLFSDADLRDLLIANSPLATPVLNTVAARDPAMNPTDHALVLAAQ